MPLLHEASIPLQLVDLDASHLLLPHGVHGHVSGIQVGSIVRLPVHLVFELLDVGLHVECLLGLVKGIDSALEEGVLHLVVLLFGHGDFLRWLVVPKVASLLKDHHVGCGVDLFEAHLELVEQAEGQAALSLHDLVDHFGVELNVEVAQGGLQFFKVLQLVRNCIPKQWNGRMRIKNVTCILNNQRLTVSVSE